MRLHAHVAAVVLAILAPSARAEPVGPAPETPAEGAAPSGDAQAALRKLFERELAPMKAVAFETPGGVKGSVEAAAAPEVKAAEGTEELVIPLGTEQPVSCTVVAERLDAGASTWRMAEAVRKGLKLLVARPVDVLAVAGSPLVLSELVYETQTEKGRMVGQLKVAVYAHDTRSLLCHHDEPGYAKTFERVVTSLAGSMEVAADDHRAESRFAEIAVMRLAGMAVGYSEQVIWDRKGGGRVLVTYGSQIFPRSPTEFAGIDSYTEQEIDAKDLLVSGAYVHMSNGDIDTKVHLSAARGGKAFEYKGEKDGKAIQGTFKTKAGLASDLWFARRLAVGAPARKGELRHEAYSFQANPAGAMPMVFKQDPANARRVEMDAGPMHLTGDLDEHGLLAAGELPIGPTKLVIERIWSRGTP